MAKILVIDDELGMRQVISKILVPLGHEIIGTDEGARALEIAREQRPDVVLLDIRLADMESSDVVASVQKTQPKVPIIVLSGFGDVEAAVELVKIGAFDYISKPFKVNEFINIINKALSKTVQESSSRGVVIPGPSYEREKNKQANATVVSLPVKKQFSKLVRPIIAVLALCLAIAAGIFVWGRYFNIPKDAEFKVPYSNPSAMCFDGQNLWVSDWTDESVYEYGVGKELKLLKTFKTPDISPTGLAFDGKNIWTSSLEQKINKHRMDASLSIEASHESPGPSPAGLCFDGKNIWSLDFQQGKIYKLKSGGNLETETSFDLPARNPCGVFIRGKYFYVADSKTNKIYELSADTFFLAAIYEIPGFGEQKYHIASVAFDGKNLWACAGRVDKLFRFRMGSLKRVKY